MRDFPITFLFLISREEEKPVVKKNLQMLESMPFRHSVALVHDDTFLPCIGDDFANVFTISHRVNGDFAGHKNYVLGSEAPWLPYIYFCDGDEVIPDMFPSLFRIMDANHSVNDNEAIAFPRMNRVDWDSEESAYQDMDFVWDQFKLMEKDHKENLGSNDREFTVGVNAKGDIRADGLLYPDYQNRLFNKQSLIGFEGKIHEQPITKNHYRYAVDLGDIIHEKTLDERIISNTLYHNITHGEVAV